MAEKAVKEYSKITGEKPKRIVRNGKAGGPVVCFLRDVFEAMGIMASPESQLQMLMK